MPEGVNQWLPRVGLDVVTTSNEILSHMYTRDFYFHRCPSTEILQSRISPFLGEAKAAYLPQTLRLEQLTRVINTEVFRRSA